MRTTLRIILIGCLCLPLVSVAGMQPLVFEDEYDEFVAAVNEAWTSSNYVRLEEIIVDRIENAPSDDLFAMGLRVELYDTVLIDYTKARGAAQDYVYAVSNRMPSEIEKRRVPVPDALFYLEQPIPTELPTPRTPESMAALHDVCPNEFPSLWLYRFVPLRIQKLEAGLITEKDLILFEEDVFLGDVDPFEDVDWDIPDGDE